MNSKETLNKVKTLLRIGCKVRREKARKWHSI